MKFGASTFIWVSPFSNDTFYLFEKVKALGFDVLEICIEAPGTIDPYEIKDAAQATGIEVLICGAFGSARDISSENVMISETGMAYTKKCIEYANLIGSPIVSGPMYAPTGLTRMISQAEREQQRKRSAENMKILANYAEERGVKLAVEPLNRFETDFMNTVDQGLEFFDMIGFDNVGFLLDTFHMNIEEKNIGDAIKRAGKKLFNFHGSSNDRGTPGDDHLPWDNIVSGIKEINYNDYIVIEAFNPKITEIARAVSIWRPLAKSEDDLASDGLKFLKKIFN